MLNGNVSAKDDHETVHPLVFILNQLARPKSFQAKPFIHQILNQVLEQSHGLLLTPNEQAEFISQEINKPLPFKRRPYVLGVFPFWYFLLKDILDSY